MSPRLVSWLGILFFGVMAGKVWGGDLDSITIEEEGIVHTWHSPNGLPSDSVSAIIQTRDGYLWIGTSSGLVRFDGVLFTEVPLEEGLAPRPLPEKEHAKSSPPLSPPQTPARVTALCEDSQGYVWIGTQDGLFQLASGILRGFSKKSGLPDEAITSLAADAQDNIWIGTRSGLSLLHEGHIKTFTHRDGLADDFVSGVHVARSGAVWITTRAGMCRYIDGHIAPYAMQTESQGRSPEYLGAYEDRRGNLWAFGDTYLINLAEGKRFNYFRGNEATSVRIWSLCEGHDGRLWIGTSGRGLFCFSENHFQPVTLGESRWPYDVRAICEDREGSLWLGTSGGGLVQISPQPVHLVHSGQGFPSARTTALTVDDKGRVVASLQRGGIFLEEGNHFEQVGEHSSLEAQDFITCLCPGPEGVIWAGTAGNGLFQIQNRRMVHFTTADGLADDSIVCLAADAQDNIWVSTAGGRLDCLSPGGLKRFDERHGLPGTRITALLASTNGSIWAGTRNGLILRKQAATFTFKIRREAPDSHPITALFEDHKNRLWIGTAGGGLKCLSGEELHTWRTADGMPSDTITGVVEDDQSNLWLATSEGIFRAGRNAIENALANPQSGIACKMMSEIKTPFDIDALDGGNRAAKSKNGRVWFATSAGLVNVDTSHPEMDNPGLIVCLESVSRNGQSPVALLRNSGWSAPLPTKQPFQMKGEVRSLEFRYTALSFVASDRIVFRHKLEGFDSDWVESGSARSARYGRLPFGHYKFRVAARTADGPWLDSAPPFVFEAPTPLYSRWWALLLYGVFAVALVAAVVRVASHRRLRVALAQLERQQSLERERMRIARDMHDEMGSKLTKISFLSEHARGDADANSVLAGKIESIAVTSRELLLTMDEIVWAVNPRNDNLEQLTVYLSHYAVEYFQKTNVECDLHLPPTIPAHPLSSEARHNLFLAFEEALNNVLKHAGASRVSVEMTVEPARFEITITDNGRGFEPGDSVAGNGQTAAGAATRVGNGLRNMRHRLAEIGGECVITQPAGGGTKVTLRISLGRHAVAQP